MRHHLTVLPGGVRPSSLDDPVERAKADHPSNQRRNLTTERVDAVFRILDDLDHPSRSQLVALLDVEIDVWRGGGA